MISHNTGSPRPRNNIQVYSSISFFFDADSPFSSSLKNKGDLKWRTATHRKNFYAGLLENFVNETFALDKLLVEKITQFRLEMNKSLAEGHAQLADI